MARRFSASRARWRSRAAASTRRRATWRSYWAAISPVRPKSSMPTALIWRARTWPPRSASAAACASAPIAASAPSHRCSTGWWSTRLSKARRPTPSSRSVSARRRISRPPLGAQRAGIAIAAAMAPIVQRAVHAAITAVGLGANEIDQRRSAKIFGEAPGCRLVDPHQRRLERQPRVHTEIDCRLQRLDGVVAAIGIAGEIGLAHAANDMLEAALVGDDGGEGEEDEIAAGYERRRQAVGPLAQR